MRATHCLVFTAFFAVAFAQRSPYAGRNPVGYPSLETTTSAADPLGNRFGAAASTEPLPIEALGDRDLVNRLSKLPVDKQPFWYLNWKALEEKRKNFETYEQRPNPFNEPFIDAQTFNRNVQNQNVQNQRSQVGF